MGPPLVDRGPGGSGRRKRSPVAGQMLSACATIFGLVSQPVALLTIQPCLRLTRRRILGPLVPSNCATPIVSGSQEWSPPHRIWFHASNSGRPGAQLIRTSGFTLRELFAGEKMLKWLMAVSQYLLLWNGWCRPLEDKVQVVWTGCYRGGMGLE